VCHAPAEVKLGTWYTVRQYGNARVSFAIPGVPGARRPIPRTATYTDREFLAARAGTYRIVINPAPQAPCDLVVRGLASLPSRRRPGRSVSWREDPCCAPTARRPTPSPGSNPHREPGGRHHRCRRSRLAP
jgi:hypothetical protein